MLVLVSASLSILAGILCIPVLTLLFELVFARTPSRDAFLERPNGESCARTAVIVPAHNEGAGILPTLIDIKNQLKANDQLIVIAHNCSDDTAIIAASAGAEVVERNDPDKIGKGYALSYGLAHLNVKPPDFVLFIDADCRVQHDMLARLQRVCAALNAPVQASFLMVASEHSPINHALAEFAWIIKNWARPLGLFALGLPVQLMGTGMIFPWSLIRNVSLASDNLVEDLKLGLDLAAAGYAPRFYPQVVGTSEFPRSTTGTDSQRQRWVQGHVGVISRNGPKLLLHAIMTQNWPLLVLVLDLAVPPLSLLLLLLLGTLLAGLAVNFMGAPSMAAAIAGANLLILACCLFLTWLRFGRQVIELSDLAIIVLQICRRLPFYLRLYIGRKATSWVRTDRSKED
jgi:cellulose synthase/poly-beta-1,6-N-acetylglucosamine synthase-like glycosyltransferase